MDRRTLQNATAAGIDLPGGLTVAPAGLIVADVEFGPLPQHVTQGHFVPVDPTTTALVYLASFNDEAALAFISEESDASALASWALSEQRTTILAAIAARIVELGLSDARADVLASRLDATHLALWREIDERGEVRASIDAAAATAPDDADLAAAITAIAAESTSKPNLLAWLAVELRPVAQVIIQARHDALP